MAGLVYSGLQAGLVSGLVLVILALAIAFPMRWIFKTWSAQRIATFSAALGPLVLGLPVLAAIVPVASNIVLLSGPEAQGFIMICVAAFVASIMGYLLGHRIVLLMLGKVQAQ